MQCRLIREMEASPVTPDDWRYFELNGHFRKLPVGTVLESEDCYLQVQLGNAEPADDECRTVAGMTDEQMKRAQFAATRVGLGIHPDDYDAYNAGIMAGYNPDGTWIPGPNYVEDDDDSPEYGD